MSGEARKKLLLPDGNKNTSQITVFKNIEKTHSHMCRCRKKAENLQHMEEQGEVFKNTCSVKANVKGD